MSTSVPANTVRFLEEAQSAIDNFKRLQEENDRLKCIQQRYEEIVSIVAPEYQRLSEEKDHPKRDWERIEKATSIATLGCARLSDLLKMDDRMLIEFDAALRECQDWVLAKPTGVDELTNGTLATKVRELLRDFGVGYADGIDDRRWNTDLKSANLTKETRLRAMVSDRRYWIFQAHDGNHEMTLAADTLVKLCQWRQLL
jgi:hypothetical protein